MSFVVLAGALSQLACIALLGWTTVDWWLGRHRAAPEGTPGGAGMEWPERALLSMLAFVGLCAAAMVAHLVTGGAVFGIAPIVPAAGIVLVIVRWRATRPPAGVPWRAVAAFAAVLAALYELPVLRAGSGLRTGDVPWHLGWTEQLLAGRPVPTGPAPRFGANAYPWGFHAVMATMVRLVPSTTPAVALEALGMLLIIAIPLAGACIARRLRSDAGWWGAAATGLIGGFGWLQARGPGFSTSPSHAAYGADLVTASPNGVYELFPPALPRELGLVLLAAAGVLVIFAALHGDRRSRIVAGVATGLVGLVSVPMFVSALLWDALVASGARARSRLRFGVTVGACAGVVFALWAGPVADAYLRYGGFVNITPHLGVEWPIVSSLSAWGLLLPLALAGVVASFFEGGAGARLIRRLVLGTVLLLALAKARGAFDWNLAGNATLLHQGRVWPVAHLLAGACAGAALAWGAAFLRRRSRTAAIAAGAVVVACGGISPVLASLALTRVMQRHEAGFIYARADMSTHSFVQRVASRLEQEDTVRVRGSSLLAFVLWQLSGAGLATYDDPELSGNDLRIRYRDLASRWNDAMSESGFAADYAVVPARAVGRGAHPLVRGTFMGGMWVLLGREPPSAPNNVRR